MAAVDRQSSAVAGMGPTDGRESKVGLSGFCPAALPGPWFSCRLELSAGGAAAAAHDSAGGRGKAMLARLNWSLKEGKVKAARCGAQNPQN